VLTARRIAFKFFEALHRAGAQRGCVASNHDFPRALNLRHPPIECSNQLAQLTERCGRCHRHQ